jgi:hypothetical protein
MKNGKAAGTSQIIAEMFKASRDTGTMLICDLIASIVKNGNMPADWEESSIVSLYKGRGAALMRGNYHDLKLLEQVLKVLEKAAESFLWLDISSDIQFGYMPGHGTTNAILIACQLQD